ncbi:MAG: hypothetical protein FD135_3216 [Comamonadaceae bacterium]|nr:MAG: hypothetical protein FD135_3216 [Comamonadaceae bacterium]
MRPMDTRPPPLIQALLAPHRYPGPVPQVELVQTHISWVLLAGEFAYKIKKPVKLPFLDFSTLALRHACCMDELRLNRRFSPDIYLDVVGIFNTPQDPSWLASGPPIEYAVKMKRFDDAGRLDHVCQRGELQAAHLSDLADTLASFHAQAAQAAADSRFGRPDDWMALARDNFHDLLLALPQPEQQARLQALRSWTEAQFTQLKPLMQARKQAGWVRECHGDLHLANLVLIHNRVRLFDCIEFNQELRWIDVANEIAFTYMDLLEQQQPGLANWWVNELLSRTGDYEAALLLRCYAVYKAMIRAKVAALQRQGAQDDDAPVLAYLALAERLAAPAPKRLVITHGLSGCGKTHASSQRLLNDQLANTLRLRSDVERKRLFGLKSTEHHVSAPGTGLYSSEASRQTYARLHQLAQQLLDAGGTVIVDAAFLRRSERDSFRALAQQQQAAFEILAPQATPEQLAERIQTRYTHECDASDATLEVLAQQMRTLEPLQADEPSTPS